VRNCVEARVERMPMARVNEALGRLSANKARYRIVLKNWASLRFGVRTPRLLPRRDCCHVVIVGCCQWLLS